MDIASQSYFFIFLMPAALRWRGCDPRHRKIFEWGGKSVTCLQPQRNAWMTSESKIVRSLPVSQLPLPQVFDELKFSSWFLLPGVPHITLQHIGVWYLSTKYLWQKKLVMSAASRSTLEPILPRYKITLKSIFGKLSLSKWINCWLIFTILCSLVLIYLWQGTKLFDKIS